jgi:hypothetical protein
MQLLEKSHAVAEHGIGSLLGYKVQDIVHETASWRAWRPIQASCTSCLAVALVRCLWGGF